MKQLYFLCSLFLLFGQFSAQGQQRPTVTQVEQLRKEMDDWMKPYRREQMRNFEQWTSWVTNREKQVREHQVYLHMDAFFQLHREQYIQLRKDDLSRYPCALESLPGYERVPDFYLPYEDKSFSMEEVLQLAQGVGNFRTLGLPDIRFVTEILSGTIFKYLLSEQHLSYEEILNQRLYGQLSFVDPIRNDQWKITVINRLYTVSFTWNIRDNQVSAPELWVYTGKSQQSGWLNDQFPESHTPTQELGNRLDSLAWTLYDEIEKKGFDTKARGEALSERRLSYYQEHRQVCTELRHQELAKYPKMDEVYLKTFSQEVPEIQEDLLHRLERTDDRYSLSSQIAPYETNGSYTINNFQFMLNRYMDNYRENTLTSWIAGKDVYSKQLTKEVWEIQFFYAKYAVSYQWNIATDEMTDFRIRASDSGEIDASI